VSSTAKPSDWQERFREFSEAQAGLMPRG